MDCEWNKEGEEKKYFVLDEVTLLCFANACMCLLISFILGFSLVQILGYVLHFSRITFQHYEILRESSSDLRQETGFPKQNKEVRLRSTVTQSMHNSGVGRDSLRTKFARFPLFCAQISGTKNIF